MRRTIFAAAAAVVVIASTRQVSAVCVDDGAAYVKQGYHANAMWPWPYVCPDRIAVREPFCLMVNNGWRRQNMLGAHHFVPETNQLNAAGQLRVQWIMTQAPADRRNIFVERSLDQNTTNQRIAAVQEYSTQVALDGHPAPVTQTHLVSEGRPATIVDFTNTKFQQSMPLPVLPAAQPSGGNASAQ
jgi:hypothetical protein